MNYEWKSLSNAIIQDGFDPNLKITYMACDRCHNVLMYIINSTEYKSEKIKNSRITINIYQCPECGNIELDCVGTYILPEYLPSIILPVIGHFMTIWTDIEDKIKVLE